MINNLLFYYKLTNKLTKIKIIIIQNIQNDEKTQIMIEEINESLLISELFVLLLFSSFQISFCCE